MKRSLRCCTLASCLSVVALGVAQAQELLTSGDFESPGGVVFPGWSLDTFVSGSGDFIDSGTPIGFNPQSGDVELWLRPFVGGEQAGPNNLTNVLLSQTTPATPGESYTFIGHSRFEMNYSGGVATLDPGSPLGAIDSPTETTLELAFLDGGGAVIGTPQRLDLRPFHDEFNAGIWIENQVAATAPAGTASARVTAEATDMVFNVNPQQSAFYDTFSLMDSSANELLSNPNLDDPPPSALDAFEITVDPETRDEIVRLAGFANRPGSAGEGVWLSSFFGADPGFETDPVGGTISQTVEAVEGGEYTFTGWTRFEANYSGGFDTLPAESASGAIPSPTETLFELAFLDFNGDVIGDPEVADLKAERQALCGDANDPDCGPAADGWTEHSLTGTAPTGATSVRVSGIMIDGVNSGLNPQSAFFDDFSLMLGAGGLVADLDDDGDVDGADFLAVQRSDASLISAWQSEFGAGVAASAAASAVPEPTGAVSLLSAGAAVGMRTRRRRSA